MSKLTAQRKELSSELQGLIVQVGITRGYSYSRNVTVQTATAVAARHSTD